MRLSIATWKDISPTNYTPGRSSAIKRITVHHAVTEADSLQGTFSDPNRNASSHFYVTKDGIEQYVDTDDTAWTNSDWVSNSQSVTIETQGTWLDNYMNQGALDSMCKLFTELRKLFPNATLDYHNDWSATQCPGTLRDKGYAQEQWDKAGKGTPAPAPVPPPSNCQYTIVWGDTLSQIAVDNGTTVEQLVAWNPQIKAPDYIQADWTIRVC